MEGHTRQGKAFVTIQNGSLYAEFGREDIHITVHFYFLLVHFSFLLERRGKRSLLEVYLLLYLYAHVQYVSIPVFMIMYSSHILVSRMLSWVHVSMIIVFGEVNEGQCERPGGPSNAMTGRAGIRQ